MLLQLVGVFGVLLLAAVVVVAGAVSGRPRKRNYVPRSALVTRLTPQAAVFYVAGFADPKECRWLIENAEKIGFERSRVFGSSAPGAAKPPVVSNVRTSQSAMLGTSAPVVRNVILRGCHITGSDFSDAEGLQVVRYEPGQFYKPHFDYFTDDRLRAPSITSLEQLPPRGQRWFTFFVYLNDVDGGGETDFPKLQLSVVPRQGDAVLWNNLDAQGNGNPQMLHQGKPPTSGVKYGLNLWIRNPRHE